MKIKRFNQLNESDHESQIDEITVGQLIDMLSGFDHELPVRMSFNGYSNQEILDVKESTEFNSDHDNEYTIVSICGVGSPVFDDETENE